jgi:hypothetical protein
MPCPFSAGFAPPAGADQWPAAPKTAQILAAHALLAAPRAPRVPTESLFRRAYGEIPRQFALSSSRALRTIASATTGVETGFDPSAEGGRNFGGM